MAVTVTTGIQAQGDGIATKRQNIVEAIDAMDPRDIPFLARKGWGTEAGSVMSGVDSLSKPCIDTTYTWQNDQLIPYKTTLSSAYAAADGVLAVATDTGVYFRVGEHLMAATLGNATVWEITGINGDSLSVTVLQGDNAHATSTEVVSMGIPQIEGRTFNVNARWTPVGTDFNYTQIFNDEVALTGTQQAVEYVGISSPMDRETMKTFAQLIIRLELAALQNNRSSAPASPQVRATFGALDYFIRAFDSNGNVQDAAGVNLSSSGESILKDTLDEAYNRGGNPDVAMMGVFQRRQVNSFLVPFVRTERSENVAGVVVGQYEYTHGVLNILMNRYTRQQHVWALTMAMLGIGPLAGNGNDRSFGWEPLPKDGDYERRFVVGEYTACVRNRTRAHGLLYNLATS